jgi:phospholipase/carboxylesterase
MTRQPDSGEIAGIPHRIRVPPGDAPHPTLVMLHGYKGMETVTWIFARAAGLEWLIASPRAPYAVGDSPDSGYSWWELDSEDNITTESYQTGLATLEKYVAGLAARHPIDPSRVVYLGFSQGAAIAYAYAITHPGAVAGVVSLGGFIPGILPKPLPPLNGLPVLIIHGTQDDTIPVSKARKDRDRLITVGAKVTYHEEAVGHKVGTEGMRLLTQWIAERLQDGS